MIFIYNLIWFLLVGLASSVILFIIGTLYCITGIGAEHGQQIYRISSYLTHPARITPDINFSSHKVANIIWIILFGWWLILLYIIAGAFLCCTLVGIPFGLQCFKNIALLAAPFGSNI